MMLLRAQPERRAVTSLPWIAGGDLFGRGTKAGVTVTPEKALGVAAVWASVTLLADVISALPVDVYRRSTDGVRTQIEPEPGLVRSPSLIYDRREWLFQGVISGALWGNVYGLEMSQTALDDYPEVVEIISPVAVTVEQASQLERPTYLISGRPVSATRVHHLRRYAMPGSAVGISPLDRHKELIGVAIAARDFAASWFGDGAHPSAILSNDTPLNDTDGSKAKTIKQRFVESIRGREPGVLAGGWKYESIQATPDDSQLVEAWNRIGVDIAQAFRVPPEMIGVAVQGSSVTYANREQRSLDFLTYAVQPWLTMFESWWTANLPPDQFAKFNTGALLRTDLKTRYESHAVALKAGFMNVDQIRQLEDNAPVPDGLGAIFYRPTSVLPVEPLTGSNTVETKAKVDAAGVLIRSGFTPGAALSAVGLDPIEHLGLLPVTLKDKE
jgi:HK97 family phage portal protein